MTLGPIIALLAAQAAPPVDAPVPATAPRPCSYGSKTDGLTVAAACATPLADGWVIAPAVVADLSYERGLADLAIHGEGWFYRRRDGRMQRMVTFDAGPDDFAEGLARAIVDGRLAYVDRRLRVRLRTRYDYGEPFKGGRARVCSGCVAQRTAGGEHSIMVGGRWATIDRKGREVAGPGNAAR